MLKGIFSFRFIGLFLLGIIISTLQLIRLNSTTEIKTYEKNNQLVILVGMTHYASSDYYREISQYVSHLIPHSVIHLSEALKGKNSQIDSPILILDEGVTDKMGLLKDSNISEIQNVMENSFICSQPNSQDLFKHSKIERADVDTKFFSKATISFLKDAYNHASQADSAFSEILEKRNEVVFKRLLDRLPQYPTIIIPWGQKHVSGLEEMILKSGFSLKSTQNFNPYGIIALTRDALKITDNQFCPNHFLPLKR